MNVPLQALLPGHIAAATYSLLIYTGRKFYKNGKGISARPFFHLLTQISYPVSFVNQIKMLKIITLECFNCSRGSFSRTVGPFNRTQESSSRAVGTFRHIQESFFRTVGPSGHTQDSFFHTVGTFGHTQDSFFRMVGTFHHTQESFDRMAGTNYSRTFLKSVFIF